MGRPDDERLSHDIGRNVCERLGLKAIIDGTIATLGRNYVLTLNATNCQTSEDDSGANRARPRARRRCSACSVPWPPPMRTRLGESLPSIKQFDVPIEQATTASLPALRAYAMGVAERRKGREVVYRLLQAGDRAGPGLRGRLHMLSTVYGGIGEFRLSEKNAQLAYEKMHASASGSGCSSPTSTTTASAAIRTRSPRRCRCGRAPTRAISGRSTHWR